MDKRVNIANLAPGMMVTKVVEQSGPVKIRKVGMIRSPDMIKGLKEMGVTVVEVDQSQSIQVDSDEHVYDKQEPSQSIQSDSKESTATQRLLVSDKQIADADRNLSQQFHRSLFMPAVDQMPSKWTLYGKPYALLVFVVIFGFCIGWYATVGAKTLLAPHSTTVQLSGNDSDALLDRSNSSAQAPTNEGTSDEETQVALNKGVAQTQADQTQSDQALNLSSSEENSAKSSVSEQPNEGGTEQRNANQSAQPAIVEEFTSNQHNNTNVQIANTQVASTDTNRSEINKPIEENRQNGLVLEEGQRVLGYNGEALSTPSVEQSTSTRNVPNTTSSRGDLAGAELLRKIQEAAQAVDSQATEPLRDPVVSTEVNDIVRIDQLSPAMLTQMPEMSFSAHMYASDPRDRWVRVNSRRLGEGDFIAEDLMLKRIDPELVILSFRGTDFSMNALSDW